MGDEDSASPGKRTPVKLPGMVIDLQQRCLDLEARICMDDGFLELLACSPGTKEHESLVAVSAKPMHIHTGLLLLGADNGHPAMRRSVNQDKTHWIDVPPRGGRVDVFLVTGIDDGKTRERPVSDFIVRATDRLTGAERERVEEAGSGASNPGNPQPPFSHTFLFLGSQLRDRTKGPRQYLADQSGHVISIATFGDEVLGLPTHQSKDNHALIWRVKNESLPPLGSRVTLRLRPKRVPPSKPPPEG